MNYFTPIKVLEPEVKAPVVPKTLTTPQTLKMSDEDKKMHLSSLTYLVPGSFVQRVSGARHGKGKKGHKLHFPSPAQAMKLNKVYTMVKTYELTEIISSTSVPVTGGYSIDYNSINDSGALTTVFDQYRIALVEFTFLPNSTQVQNGAGNTPPLFHSVVDVDDFAAVSVGQLEDYPGCQTTLAVYPHKHVFVPHCALAAYSGTFTSYANVEAPWIDVASPAVQHYGVKYGFGVTAGLASYSIRIRVMLEMKNIR